jgi:hypothetical protein
MLVMDCETKIPLDGKARAEVVSALADLLLEAMDAQPGQAAEATNESED